MYRQTQIVMHLAASLQLNIIKNTQQQFLKITYEMLMNTIHLSTQSNTVERFLITSSLRIQGIAPYPQEEEGLVSPNLQTLLRLVKRMEEYLVKNIMKNTV